MQTVEKKDWAKIPVGSILKANTHYSSLYGIVRAVSFREYALTFLMLGISVRRCNVFYRLHISNVYDFEILDLEEVPLILGCGYTQR